VGDNFFPNAWALKSCQFENLCWSANPQADEAFTLYPTTPQRNITSLSPYARSSTDFEGQHVSVSALLPSWMAEQRHRWFPTLVADASSGEDEGYYELPASVVWIPMAFDPAFLQGPSSILFDILLPIYTLVTLFGVEDRQIFLTPVHQASSCFVPSTTTNASTTAVASCYPQELQPYLELLNLVTLPVLSTATQQPPRICARRAVAGLGALADHGHKKRHGERAADYQTSQNVGKGALLWDFRRYLLRNAAMGTREKSLGVVERVQDLSLTGLVFSATDGPAHFEVQATLLQEQLPDVSVQHVDLSELSLQQQLSIAVQSSFWVTRVGEASVPAFFLPRGGTLVVYYRELVTTGTKKATNRPAMIHWDLLNHASHLTVHWLPEDGMDTPQGLRLLLEIVQLQLDYLSREKDGTTPLERVQNNDGKAMALGESVTWVPDGNRSSTAHCLGDNFIPAQAPCYRSCQYRHLCLDVQQREFQLVKSELQSSLQQSLRDVNDGFRVVASDLNQSLMEGRNVRFVQTVPWAPSVVDTPLRGYFALPPDILWIPYTLDASFAGNPGHLLWDFMLPFFTLGAMYGNEKKRLLLTSLDDECRTTPKCDGLVKKFFPLLRVSEIYSMDELQIQQPSPNQVESSVKYVCARHGAAGMGMLTEHGSTRHGQNVDDYQLVQNSGRGGHFYAFRSFMIRNMGIDEQVFTNRPRHGVLFSINSSTSLPRRKSFTKQIGAAREGLGKDAFVSGVEFARFPLKDQLEAMLQTSVYVSTVGGSTATAMFLPRHASLILYFSSDESFVGRSRKKDMPTMMDFDFWNNAAYMRVHWLPTGTMDEDFHVEFLVDLIRSELAQTERFRLI
jgi:hypothetical protein